MSTLSLPVVDMGDGDPWVVVFHVYNRHNPVDGRYRLWLRRGEDLQITTVDEATGRAIMAPSNHRTFVEAE